MNIMINQVRIMNFRSLATIDVVLGMTNVLIGQNNSGKSNFLKAIDIALNGARTISDRDIFVRDGERLAPDKSAIIDVCIIPIDTDSKQAKQFSPFWTGVFTDKWITTDETNGDFVGIRTIISYDIRRNDYSLTRRPIKEWNESIDKAIVGQKQQFGIDMVEYINSFFMDAHRDASEDIKSKKSYFGKATSQTDLPEALINRLEEQLNEVNGEIIRNIPALQQTSECISAIGKTLGDPSSTVQIEPLTRKISDLHKGMDVTFKDGASASFSISQHGLGTRSWITFLTLGAYIEWFSEKILNEDQEADNFVMLTMEEPEAHLHPQAQRQLYSQIVAFKGQKIVSTHSPNVLAQAKIADIIHFYKANGVTNATRIKTEDYSKEEINRIQREVINTRGELLFSKAVILCEGVTEEQALPVYFNEFFGTEPIFSGVNIIGIGGQNYKSFLKLIKDFSIKWFIFSDGEQKTIKTVKNAIKIMTEEQIENLKNVVILEDGEDYETHLIHAGYQEIMKDAINKCEESVIKQEDNQNGEERESYFDSFIRINNHTSCGRFKTDKAPCETCRQDIYEDKMRDYDGPDGLDRAIYDCCTGKNAKAKYARYIAEHIVFQATGKNKIPPKVISLFKEISRELNLDVRSEYCET